MRSPFDRNHIQAAQTGELAPSSDLRYDYSQIDGEQAREAAQTGAERIRSLLSSTRQLFERSKVNAWQMGQHFTQVKAELSHGEWLGWLEAEFGREEWGEYAITDRTAQRWMRLAETLQLEQVRETSLGLSTLYDLTAKSTPLSLVDRALEAEREGETVSRKRVQEWKQEAQQSAQTPLPQPSIQAASVSRETLPPAQPEKTPGDISENVWREAHLSRLIALRRQVIELQEDARAVGRPVDGYAQALAALEAQQRSLV